MQDELSVRQTAIRLRLAGESVESICRTLKRSRAWWHKWWQRYLESGPAGLHDLTRGHRQVVNRTPPHIERAVIRIRRLCLRVGVEPVFIPKGKPQHNGSVEHFNGWFQSLPLRRPFGRPGDVRRERLRLMLSVNEQHVHAPPGGCTPLSADGAGGCESYPPTSP